MNEQANTNGARLQSAKSIGRIEATLEHLARDVTQLQGIANRNAGRIESLEKHVSSLQHVPALGAEHIEWVKRGFRLDGEGSRARIAARVNLLVGLGVIVAGDVFLAILQHFH